MIMDNEYSLRPGPNCHMRNSQKPRVSTPYTRWFTISIFLFYIFAVRARATMHGSPTSGSSHYASESFQDQHTYRFSLRFIFTIDYYFIITREGIFPVVMQFLHD